MHNRKILTLNECLELERPLTLQEAVDLPIDTYKEYLYYRGILKYLPEKLEEYVTENDEYDDYHPEVDAVLRFKDSNFSERLLEDLDVKHKRIAENCLWDGQGYTLKKDDYEDGIININGKDYNYCLETAGKYPGKVGIYKVDEFDEKIQHAFDLFWVYHLREMEQDMHNRRILTLNECLELERPITLQEAMDLPLDTYTKYLYYRGILKYLPESLVNYTLENLEDKEKYHYYSDLDIVLMLKGIKIERVDEDYEIDEATRREWDEEYEATKHELPEIEYSYIYVGEQQYYAMNCGNVFTVYELLENNQKNIIECGVFYV